MRGQAAGLTSDAILKKLSNIQMINIHLPTTDGRRIVMCSYTQPDKDDSVLLDPWDCHFLNNRRPRFMHQDRSGCSADLLMCPLEFTGLAACLPLELRRSS